MARVARIRSFLLWCPLEAAAAVHLVAQPQRTAALVVAQVVYSQHPEAAIRLPQAHRKEMTAVLQMIQAQIVLRAVAVDLAP